MGFDVTRFESPLVKEMPHFFCPSCDNVLKEPKSVSTCGHVFCTDCIKTLVGANEGVCPVDGQSFEGKDVREEQELDRKLGELDMICDYSVFGCNEKVKMKDLSFHCKECLFSPDALLECSDNCGASFEGKQKETTSHYFCSASVGSEETVKLDNHSSHSNNGPFRPLLVAAKRNLRLTEKIIAQSSRNGIEMVNKIIEAQNKIETELQVLLEMQADDEEEADAIEMERDVEEAAVRGLTDSSETMVGSIHVEPHPDAAKSLEEMESKGDDESEFIVIDVDPYQQQREDTGREEHRLAMKSTENEEWVRKSLNSKGKRVEFLMKRMSFPCESCGTSFNRRSLLMAHHPCHSHPALVQGKSVVNQPYVCVFCFHRNNDLNCLRKHLEQHVDNEMYQCIDCGKKCCRERDICVHQRQHSGDRPYRCRLCPKTFSQSFLLKDHFRCHSGEKPIHCLWPGCEKSFSSTSLRRKHMLSHRPQPMSAE